jgi:hypothetical protein
MMIFCGTMVKRLQRLQEETALTSVMPLSATVKTVLVFDPILVIQPKKRAAPKKKETAPTKEPPKAAAPKESSWSLSETDSSSDEPGAKLTRNPKLRENHPPTQPASRVPVAGRIPTRPRPRPIDRPYRPPNANCPECCYLAPRHANRCARRC